jgi:hypothetical protein
VQLPEPLAGGAVFLAQHGNGPLPAANRLLELERDRLVEIDAALRRPLRALRLALVQHVGEQIAESRRVVAVDADREVEPVEAERRVAARVGPRAGRVVAATAFEVAQRLVRLRDLTELRRRHPVTRVDVRMELPRQPLVGALDVGHRGLAIDAEDHIKVHFRLQPSDF